MYLGWAVADHFHNSLTLQLAKHFLCHYLKLSKVVPKFFGKENPFHSEKVFHGNQIIGIASVSDFLF